MSELTDDFLRDTGRMKRERDWPEPEDIYAMRHPDEAEIAALRRRNEKLERVALDATRAVRSRNKPSPWADPLDGKFYIVETAPMDDLVAALSDLDKED